MGDATNETFEVTLQRQGPYPAQRHGFSCQATHEAVLARAIQLHEEHLAQREVDPSSVVLRFRDQDGQLLTIHDDLNLVRAMEEARDSQGLVQLDFLLQVAPQARQQRQCRSCQQLFTSRNQLFLHLKASGHDEDLPSDEEPHESAGAGSLKNDAFCDYYRQQRIVPEELWPLAYEALKTPLPLVLRATGHALATDCEQRLAEMTELAPLPLCSHAWMLPCRLDPKVKSFIAAGQALGVWHRQEWASMLPVLALEVKPDETVLDLCASPGSKTLQLLEYQSGASVDGGLLVANELSRSRALVVAQRSRRADRRSLLVTNLDGRQFPALKTPQGRKRKFQKVLVDAPCSGDGTLRKSCGGWATWRAAEGNSLHPLQRGLLRRGFELLEPGGRLVYSTCSLNPIENEAVVAAFLSETSNAELLSWDPLKVESFQEGVTEWMVPESDFETSRLMHKSYDAPQLPKSQAALFPPKNELLQASLRRCRRLVPLSPEAHHGGFFVAVVTKSKGPKSPNPSAAQEWEPVEVEADLEQKVKKHPMRRLFQPVPVERWAALQAYWSLDLPVERLSANRLGQLVLATRTLAACCVSRKVDLPIVEGGLALFPAEGLKPFDEAVSFLSGYTPRKKQLTLMEFLEMVKAEQKEEEEEEEDLHIFTLEAVTEPCKRVFAVLGATQNGRAWCVASPRYRQVLLEVLREIVKTRDVQQSKEDAALSC